MDRRSAHPSPLHRATPAPASEVRPSRLTRTVAHLRLFGPWLLRDTLRAALVLILATVSGWYLTRWALANGWPMGLAWTLMVALDAAGLLAIVVMSHPRDAEAKRAALRLAWGAGALSVLGNSAMHAVDHGWLKLEDGNTGLIAAVLTGAVYPAMLVWAAHTATGMAPRPVALADRPAAAVDPELARATLGTLYDALGVATPGPKTAARRARPAASRPAAASTPPAAAAGPAPDDTPTTEVARVEAVPATGDHDPDVLVLWALDNLQPNGSPAGWKAIRSAHPGLTEHRARTAATAARAESGEGLRAVVGGQ